MGVLLWKPPWRHGKEPDIGEMFKLSRLLIFDLFPRRDLKWALADSKSEVGLGFRLVLE